MQNHIAEWRKKKGLSQRQLAKLLLVPSGSVSEWEGGLHEPRVSMALEIARLLECCVEDIFKL